MDALRHILNDLLDCSRSLQRTLLAERDSLTEHNLNTLNRHAEEKKDTLVHLEALEVQRRQILNGLGLDTKHESIVPELEDLWQLVLEALRDCQDANEVNGAIVRTHHAQTQRALDLLAGRDSRQTVYQSDGLSSASARSEEIAKA